MNSNNLTTINEKKNKETFKTTIKGVTADFDEKNLEKIFNLEFLVVDKEIPYKVVISNDKSFTPEPDVTKLQQQYNDTRGYISRFKNNLTGIKESGKSFGQNIGNLYRTAKSRVNNGYARLNGGKRNKRQTRKRK